MASTVRTLEIPRDVRKLRQLLIELGGDVHAKRGTGEWVWRHHIIDRPCVTQCKSRRCDPSRALIHFIRTVARKLGFRVNN